MNGKSRLGFLRAERQGEAGIMKGKKAMLIALIVICLTVIVTALVTRKDPCEVRTEPARRRSSHSYEPEEARDRAGRNPSPPLMCQASSTHPHLTRFGVFPLGLTPSY